MDSRTAEHPRPNHFLLHLSDTHLVAGDGDLYGDVDSAARSARSSRTSRRRVPDRKRSSSPATSRTRARPARTSGSVRSSSRQRTHRCAGDLGDGQPRRAGRLPSGALRTPADGSTGRLRLRRQRAPHHHPRHERAGAHHGEVSPSSWTGSPRSSPRLHRTAPSWRCTTRRCPASRTSPCSWSSATRTPSPRWWRAATSSRSSPVTCTTRRGGVRRHPRLGGQRHVLHAGPHGVPGRDARARRSAVVQPDARVRQQRRALGRADRPLRDGRQARLGGRDRGATRCRGRDHPRAVEPAPVTASIPVFTLDAVPASPIRR